MQLYEKLLSCVHQGFQNLTRFFNFFLNITYKLFFFPNVLKTKFKFEKKLFLNIFIEQMSDDKW